MPKRAKYKLLLINPLQKYQHYATQYTMAHLMGKKNVNTSLALPILAGLTPNHYEIKIVDEQLESLPKNFNPDIVGITTLTSSINRTFKLADHYRKNGAKVILGGPYITFAPEEADNKADSIVIGEAEGMWEQCLADFEKGNLKKIYKRDQVIEFKTNVTPRWDLVKTNRLVSLSVQATRGCPFGCDFCLVTNMFGRKMRFREIDNVIEEIKALPVKRFLFVDDNLTINKKYAMELMDKLEPLNVKWTCQASIDVAFDDELLNKMAKAGCNYIIIGFESVNQESLNETAKTHNNAQKYKEAIERINKAGIMIYSSFIVGFDHDTLDEFDNIFNFVQDAKLPIVMLNILGATQGTNLYDKLCKSGRWYGSKKEYRGGFLPVMHYYKISQIDLYDRFIETLKKLYTIEAIRERSLPLFKKGYFNKKTSDKDVSLITKIRVSILILYSFVFSRNKEKRELFKELLKLKKENIISTTFMVMFLIIMMGVKKHLKNEEKNNAFFRKEILKVDKGPWEEQMKNNVKHVS